MANKQQPLEDTQLTLKFTNKFLSELNKFSINARILVLSWIHKNFISETEEFPFEQNINVKKTTFTKIVFHNFAVFIDKEDENIYKFVLITKNHRRETAYSSYDAYSIDE